jgi:hypothetical protein
LDRDQQRERHGLRAVEHPTDRFSVVKFPPSTYEVATILREGQMVSDDWHATVTRKSDGAQLIFIAPWRWLLKLKVRKKALDRAFRDFDDHEDLVESAKEVYEI